MGSIQNSIVTNNNFIVSLNLLVFSFSKVTNIAGNIEMEAVEEGGYNVHYHAYPGDHEWNVWRKCARDFAMEIFK